MFGGLLHLRGLNEIIPGKVYDTTMNLVFLDVRWAFAPLLVSNGSKPCTLASRTLASGSYDSLFLSLYPLSMKTSMHIIRCRYVCEMCVLGVYFCLTPSM